MKKKPTLFKREFLDHHVINIFPVLSSPDLAWVLAGEGVATEKISCAAPNLRKTPGNQYNPESGAAASITPDELQRLHEKLARSILATAVRNGVDILLLGAFGCGAFRNDPNMVARAYANVLKDCRRHFDLIEFAIFCRGFETENYDAFTEALVE